MTRQDIAHLLEWDLRRAGLGDATVTSEPPRPPSGYGMRFGQIHVQVPSVPINLKFGISGERDEFTADYACRYADGVREKVLALAEEKAADTHADEVASTWARAIVEHDRLSAERGHDDPDPPPAWRDPLEEWPDGEGELRVAVTHISDYEEESHVVTNATFDNCAVKVRGLHVGFHRYSRYTTDALGGRWRFDGWMNLPPHPCGGLPSESPFAPDATGRIAEDLARAIDDDILGEADGVDASAGQWIDPADEWPDGPQKVLVAINRVHDDGADTLKIAVAHVYESGDVEVVQTMYITFEPGNPTCEFRDRKWTLRGWMPVPDHPDA